MPGQDNPESREARGGRRTSAEEGVFSLLSLRGISSLLWEGCAAYAGAIELCLC